MKKIFALILALAMVLTLFAGCGSNSASEAVPADSAPAAVSEPDEDEAPEAEEVPADEDSDIEEDSAAEPAEEEVEEEVVYANAAERYLAETKKTDDDYLAFAKTIESDISYPLEDADTVSIFRVFSAFIWGDLASSYADFAIMPSVTEKTGMNLEFIEVSDAAAYEQFNLTIASGDMPDLMNMDYYTGKTVGALEDDVIFDLTDLLDEHMPTYAALIETMDDYTKKTLYTTDGSVLAAYTIASDVISEQGLAYRADWAQEVGIEDLKTVDDLYDYLVAVNDIHPCTYPLFIDGSAVLEGFTGAYGTPGITLSWTDLGMMLDGDEVVASIADEHLRDYVEGFNKFYTAGLIKDDFYSESYGPDYINAYIIDDLCAVSTIRSDKFTTLKKNASSPSFSFEALAPLTSEKVDEYRFNQKRNKIGMGSFCVTTSCEDLETVMEFMDWFYTPEGYILANYGDEGVAFEYNEEGIPCYTDVIVNNPEGYNMMSLRNFYTNPMFPFYQNATSLFSSYADVELDAFDTWNNNGTADCTLPTISLDADENSEYSNIATTIYTFASEKIMKWMIGEEELTDEAWQDYVDTCNSMGLADAVDIYQQYYDRTYK